ncbi:MAG: Ku protein [Saprospiraceae bacterium]
MRSVWKGHIRFSLVTIPVRLYNAIESSQTISFRQLHKKDNSPIGYDKKCKACGETVKSEDILKGYEYAPDQYVIMESSDLEKIKLKSNKIIDIEAFVKKEEVNPALFDTPYFAGPDGDVATKAYGLLKECLDQTHRLAVGRVILRDKEEIVLIAPNGPGLMMYMLRYPDELRNIEAVPQLDPNAKIDDAQLKLANVLVETMSKSFKDLELKDRYFGSVMEIIQAKIAGKEIVSVKEEETPIVDIMTALKESISQAKAEIKPMVKATGDSDEDIPASKKKKSA